MTGFWRDLSLKWKLLIAFILLIFIPLFISNIMYYYKTGDYIKNNTTSYLNEINTQINTTIDTYLKQIDKLSIQTAYSKYIYGLMQKDYKKISNPEYEYNKDLGETYRYLMGMMKTADGVENIFIYTGSGHNYYGYTSSPVDYSYHVGDEPWYRTVLQSEGNKVLLGPHKTLQLSNKNQTVISLVRQVRSLKDLSYMGIINIDVDINILEDILRNTGRNLESSFYILDDKGNIVFESNNTDGIDSYFKPDILKKLSRSKSYNYEDEINHKKYYINYTTSDFSGWKVINITAKENIYKGLDAIKQSSVMVGIMLVFFAVIASIIISNSIMRPIKKLKKMIAKIENGDFDTTIQLTSRDEIGLFANSFNRMTVRLKQLIQQIYDKEEEKRKAEILVLQEQIKPHFIYNTLSTIKFMATVQKSTGITKMTEALIALLRASAKYNGKLITIEEEIYLIKSYIFIQQTRYYEKFSVNFNYDEAVLKYKTLNLILQPMVENAIFHGISAKNGKGSIDINIEAINDEVVYVIEDDGIGMTEEEARKILTRENNSGSIGIYNVDKRIKLYFGDKYGIRIESTPNVCTRIIIRIPTISEVNNLC